MKDYFSHDYNSRNDAKLVRSGMKFGMCQTLGAYWCIVEMLYEEGGYLPLSEYERITFELRCSNELITYLINDSELLTLRLLPTTSLRTSLSHFLGLNSSTVVDGSLPDRQLRNFRNGSLPRITSSLPDRQLRKSQDKRL